MIRQIRTDPPRTYDLTGHYILWQLNKGRDLSPLLRRDWLPQEVAKDMIRNAERDRIASEVIDARRGLVAWPELKPNGQWVVWELRLHQRFDTTTDALTFAKASDAVYKARGKRPPCWTVLGFGDK